MVRNFWIKAVVDGYKTELEGGPRAKKDGMRVTLYQREGGEIVEAVKIACRADGDILLTTVDVGGERVGVYQTKR